MLGTEQQDHTEFRARLRELTQAFEAQREAPEVSIDARTAPLEIDVERPTRANEYAVKVIEETRTEKIAVALEAVLMDGGADGWHLRTITPAPDGSGVIVTLEKG